MTETFQPSRRAVLKGAASTGAIAALSYFGTAAAAVPQSRRQSAGVPEQQAGVSEPKRRVPVGLL